MLQLFGSTVSTCILSLASVHMLNFAFSWLIISSSGSSVCASSSSSYKQHYSLLPLPIFSLPNHVLSTTFFGHNVKLAVSFSQQETPSTDNDELSMESCSVGDGNLGSLAISSVIDSASEDEDLLLCFSSWHDTCFLHRVHSLSPSSRCREGCDCAVVCDTGRKSRVFH